MTRVRDPASFIDRRCHDDIALNAGGNRHWRIDRPDILTFTGTAAEPEVYDVRA